MNTVGSSYNRQDTYAYFDYPFCHGTKTEIEHYHESLAETLLGIELEFSGLDIQFKGILTFNFSIDIRILTANAKESIILNNFIKIFCTENVTKTKFCGVQLDHDKVVKFRNAIDNSYQYQMYLDELPIWGVVGERVNDDYYVYKHKIFILGYNLDRIVNVNFTVDDRELLANGKIIEYSYEVHWVPSNIPFNMRFEKYLDTSFYQHKVSFLKSDTC